MRATSPQAVQAAYSPFRDFAGRVPESFWVSLVYFNLYRVAVAAVFLGSALVYHDELTLGQHNLPMFLTVCAGYLGIACAFQAGMKLWHEQFNLHLTVHAMVDIVAITLLMYASGGMKSGLGVMLLVSITGASLVAPRRLTFLYAALASIAALFEQGYWMLLEETPTGSFLQPALLSIGYFVTAGITGQLAQRVVANEELARKRGRELQNQLRVNQLVIGDMQDGVLVLDREARVVQSNPQGARLLGVEPLAGMALAQALPDALPHWHAWRHDPAVAGPERPSVCDLTVRGRDLRLRFIDTGTEEGFTVAFVEDVERIAGAGAAVEARRAGPPDGQHGARDPQSAGFDQPCVGVARRIAGGRHAAPPGAHHRTTTRGASTALVTGACWTRAWQQPARVGRSRSACSGVPIRRLRGRDVGGNRRLPVRNSSSSKSPAMR